MENPPAPVPDDVSVNSSEGHQVTCDNTLSGVFSSVGLCKVYRAHLGTLSRVTFYHKGQTHLRDHPELQRHVESLSLHRHPNVATVFSVESQPGQTSLLVEHPECGEFAAYVKSHVVTWSQVVGITRDVLTGLTFLEASNRGVSPDVQIDIGLANVWMFSRGVAKVACCGLSLVDQTYSGTNGLSKEEELPSPASDVTDGDYVENPCHRGDVHR
ncbi:uncharacterized protein LOC135469443 [Liolophura sinensis]|uniref:uncharacterized protein LOC135469443 n=1 Tax=Liolophura sinensis TaxID=3198878 RepID=UPI0031593105